MHRMVIYVEHKTTTVLSWPFWCQRKLFKFGFIFRLLTKHIEIATSLFVDSRHNNSDLHLQIVCMRV